MDLTEAELHTLVSLVDAQLKTQREVVRLGTEHATLSVDDEDYLKALEGIDRKLVNLIMEAGK